MTKTLIPTENSKYQLVHFNFKEHKVLCNRKLSMKNEVKLTSQEFICITKSTGIWTLPTTRTFATSRAPPRGTLRGQKWCPSAAGTTRRSPSVYVGRQGRPSATEAAPWPPPIRVHRGQGRCYWSPSATPTFCRASSDVIRCVRSPSASIIHENLRHHKLCLFGLSSAEKRSHDKVSGILWLFPLPVKAICGRSSVTWLRLKLSKIKVFIVEWQILRYPRN